MTRKGSGGRFDFGGNDAARLRTFKIKSYDFKSQSDMQLRPTGNYADNAMADPTKINETGGDDGSMVERLLDKMLRSGITVEQIKDGATLGPTGIQKVAAEFGISASEVKMLLNSLPKHLTTKDNLLTELKGVRFSYEADFMGNVVVRDNQSADEEPVMVSGSRGQKLLGQLTAHEGNIADQQKLLAQAMQETVNESDDGLEPNVNFIEEIANDAGSFNFPWKIGKQHGFGLASYRGDGRDFEIKVEDVRNEDGDEIVASDDMLATLKKQAIAYIPEA
jgi:hypothetical protein